MLLNKLKNKIYLTVTLFLMISSLWAQRLETKEKVFIQSDSGTFNFKTGIKVFHGNVKVDQGNTHLTADKLVTKEDEKHQIKEAIAYGLNQPAHYWTIPRPKELAIHANAKIIKFYPQDFNVTLEEDVLVKQGENSFKGQLILYNKVNQTITVPASQNGRAVLVYDPEQ